MAARAPGAVRSGLAIRPFGRIAAGLAGQGRPEVGVLAGAGVRVRVGLAVWPKGGLGLLSGFGVRGGGVAGGCGSGAAGG